MFTCSACLRRALDSFPRHRLPRIPRAGYRSLPPLRTATKASRPNREYSTEATHARTEDDKDKTRPITTQDFLDADHGSNKAPLQRRPATWAARKELEYLSDPLHIANRVAVALQKENFELAAQMTRQASKDKSVTVSWNHLIEFQLRQGRIHAAMKLYNEVRLSASALAYSN